ncbi:MAG: DUF4386 domain-containing protein [Candidatus Thorarchaeota archaeon]
MSEGLSLERIQCARNGGVLTLLRIILGTFAFLALGTMFYFPTESMVVAIQSVKANLLFFILMLCALVPLSFISLVVAFPLNNVLTNVDKNVSLLALRLRIIEALLFIAGIVLMFAEISLFYQVLLVGIAFYAVHLILIGYLVFKSGYLNGYVGIILGAGASFGYLLESITGFLAPTFVWISTVGVAVAIMAEVALGFILIIAARNTTFDDPDSRTRIIRILRSLGEATTTEIIAEATKESGECRDRAPRTLSALESENQVKKKFSKEKKGYVWSLAE